MLSELRWCPGHVVMCLEACLKRLLVMVRLERSQKFRKFSPFSFRFAFDQALRQGKVSLLLLLPILAFISPITMVTALEGWVSLWPPAVEGSFSCSFGSPVHRRVVGP